MNSEQEVSLVCMGTNMVVIYCMYVLVHGGGVVWPDRRGVRPDRSGQISGLSCRPTEAYTTMTSDQLRTNLRRLNDGIVN